MYVKTSLLLSFPIYFFHFKPDRRTPIRRSLLFSFILSFLFLFPPFQFWGSWGSVFVRSYPSLMMLNFFEVIIDEGAYW